MKTSSILVLFTAALVSATPAPQPQVSAGINPNFVPGSDMDRSYKGMVSAAEAIPALFSKGDTKGASDALAKLVGAAAAFPGAFFNDAKSGKLPKELPGAPKLKH